jgi:hypothetical protein
LPFAFKTVFESLEVKAALLLYTLLLSMENIVDNLQTKESLTYDQVYQRLMDLSGDDRLIFSVELVRRNQATSKLPRDEY